MNSSANRWAALDAPTWGRPKRFDPARARASAEPWRDIRTPGSPDPEWFERVAVTHMNHVLGLDIAVLAAPGAPLVDVVVPGDRFAVAQVKSGAQQGNAHVLADAVAGARVPGSRLSARHPFVYTESGFTGGTLVTSEQQFAFLFTIDKRGVVRPWNRAARRLTDPEPRARFLPRRGSGTLTQLWARQDRDTQDPAYERAVMTWLDFCSEDRYDEVSKTRQAVLDHIEQMWLSAGLPAQGLAPKWRDFAGFTLEEGELTGRGGTAAQVLVDQADAAITTLAGTPQHAATGQPMWSMAVNDTRRVFARQRLVRLAQEGMFADEDEVLPDLLVGLADQAWAPGTKWVTAEAVWRDFLLAWDDQHPPRNVRPRV